MKKFQFLLLGLLSSSFLASAQVKVSHPGPGTPERIAVLDGMRSKTQADLKIPEVQYVVNTINVTNDWAYVLVAAKRKDGKPINAKAVCAYEIHGDECITKIEAVLRNVNGNWKLEEYFGGATDLWQMGYCDKKNFPIEIFGMKRGELCPPGYGQSMPPIKK